MNFQYTNEWLAGELETGWDIHWLFIGHYWMPSDFIGFAFGLCGFYVEIGFNLGRGM